MTDGGFGQITSPAKAAQSAGRGLGGQLIQIIKLPAQVDNLAKAIRLEGEVTRVNQDGTVRISTPQGDVEAQVKSNRPLTVGQKVDVDIPAARPPQQAVLKPKLNVNADQASRVDTGRGASSGAVQGHTPSTPPNAGGNVGRAQVAPAPVTTTPSTGQPQAGSTVQPSLPQAQSNLPNVAAQRVLSRAVTEQIALQQPLVAGAGQTATVVQSGSASQRGSSPLQIGDTVRLISVPPAQAQDIATNFTNSIRISPVNLGDNQGLLNAIKNPIVSSNLLNVSEVISSPVQAKITLLANTIQQQSSILNNPLQVTITNHQSAAVPLSQNAPVVLSSSGQSLPLSTVAINTAATLNASFSSVADFILPHKVADTILQPALTAHIVKGEAVATQSQFAANIPNITTVSMPRLDAQIVKFDWPVTPLTPATTQSSEALNIPAKTALPSMMVSASVAGSIPAQVTGFTQQGFPLVTMQWPGAKLPQSFVLQFPADNLTIGSRLHLLPQTAQATAPVLTQAGASLTTPLLRGFQWPAMDQLYQLLIQSAPQVASSLVSSLPTPGNPAQIGAAGMMFIAAVRGGDLSGWLGQKNIDTIQRLDARGLLSRLTQARGATATTAAEPATAGEWRAVPLPMFWEGEIQKITLYTRQENEREQRDNDKDGGQTRFLLDLSLSRMGEVQIDGLLKEPRLDLVVRTERAFSLPMQQTMRQAYLGALEETRLTGDVIFQGNRKNWVSVLEAKEQLGVDV